jgi:ribulose-phosphate 3-epimerase
MAIVVPAILTNDENTYHDNLLKAERVSNLVQVDIVDGKFADTTTVGTDIIAKYFSSASLEAHLMVKYPLNFISDLVKIDYVSKIILPYEIEGNHHDYIYQVKNNLKQVGLSINPGTPVAAILHLLDDLDMLLILGVEPGRQGQEFKEEVLLKIQAVKKVAPGLPIELDGGLRFENVNKIKEAGADFIAAGSILFKAEDFFVAWEKLTKLAG